MRDSGKDYYGDRTLGAAVIIYCGILFAGFVVGLYGLFTLLWLASATAQRAGYAMFY